MARGKKPVPASLTLAIDIVFTLLAGLFIISKFEKVEALIIKREEVDRKIQASADRSVHGDSTVIYITQIAGGNRLAFKRYDASGQLREPVPTIEAVGAELDREKFGHFQEWVDELDKDRRIKIWVGPRVQWGVVAQVQDVCNAREIRPVWEVVDR